MECTHPALGAATAVTRRRYYGTIVVARDEMEDSEGANLVTDPVDVAGNVIVVELETGHFVVLAHLRHATLAGQRRRPGSAGRSAGPGRKLR